MLNIILILIFKRGIGGRQKKENFTTQRHFIYKLIKCMKIASYTLRELLSRLLWHPA